VVFKLTSSGGVWTESVLHSFTGGSDGDAPLTGVTFDQEGNLYGTASEGGAVGYGTVYQLTPQGTEWTETTLHSFTGGYDGAYSAGGLIADPSGNLYGTTSASLNAGGTVFELVASNGAWTFTELYLFTFPNDPTGDLTLFNGNLYGVTFSGGDGGNGSVFELTPGSAGWSATTLYSFNGHDKNAGLSPTGGVSIDADGNIYGTTNGGGIYYDGVIFKLAP
jgi:uncharacterized repeat protein (TIGR03803 family)